MSKLQNYIQFTSVNPRLNFSFLYPTDWQAREVKGKETEYDEVFILGPRNRENTYSLSLAARATPVGAQSGKPADLDAAIAGYVDKNRQSAKFREISRVAGSLAGVEAVEIEIIHTIPLPINNVNAKEMPIRERRIFLKKTDQVYELTYIAVEEDFFKYLEAFKNAAHTFEFREDAAQQTHWPVVMPAAAHAVREQPAGYKPEK